MSLPLNGSMNRPASPRQSNLGTRTIEARRMPQKPVVNTALTWRQASLERAHCRVADTGSVGWIRHRAAGSRTKPPGADAKVKHCRASYRYQPSLQSYQDNVRQLKREFVHMHHWKLLFQPLEIDCYSTSASNYPTNLYNNKGKKVTFHP